MNSHRPDLSKHPWPISPTFRTGPRQVGYDQNAEEIIRFVRHFQRSDTQQLGATCVKRKAVLPAIGGYFSCTGGNSPTNNGHHGQGSVESELKRFVDENQTGYTTLKNIVSNDIQHFEISCDATGGVYESNNNSFEGTYTHQNVELPETIELQEAKENTYISNSQESLNDIAKNTSLIRDDQLLTSRSSIACNGLNKFKVANNTTPVSNIDFSKAVSLKYCSKSSSNMGQLRQLQALPQLPPITTRSFPSRPSAPSPSPMSPATMSSSDTDNFSDDGRDEEEI